MANEKLAEKIARIEKELKVAEEQMASCKHEFGKPVHATRDYKEPIFLRFEGHGSDPEPIYDWQPRTEHGYKRTCEKCGFSQYTAKTKPIVTCHEPDFQ